MAGVTVPLPKLGVRTAGRPGCSRVPRNPLGSHTGKSPPEESTWEHCSHLPGVGWAAACLQVNTRRSRRRRGAAALVWQVSRRVLGLGRAALCSCNTGGSRMGSDGSKCYGIKPLFIHKLFFRSLLDYFFYVFWQSSQNTSGNNYSLSTTEKAWEQNDHSEELLLRLKFTTLLSTVFFLIFLLTVKQKHH